MSPSESTASLVLLSALGFPRPQGPYKAPNQPLPSDHSSSKASSCRGEHKVIGMMTAAVLLYRREKRISCRFPEA